MRRGSLNSRYTFDNFVIGNGNQFARAASLAVAERPFTLGEAYAAREAFLSAASLIVLPVVEIDGRYIGDGRPGPIALTLRRRFHEIATRG